MNTLDHYAAVIGIDWADRKHDLCLRIAGSGELTFSVLPHTPSSHRRLGCGSVKGVGDNCQSFAFRARPSGRASTLRLTDRSTERLFSLLPKPVVAQRHREVQGCPDLVFNFRKRPQIDVCFPAHA